MSCISIVANPRACGTGVVAGLSKLYMIAYKDLVPATNTTNVFATATNGVISEIGLDTGKKFVEVGLLRSSAGLKEDSTIDHEKGLDYMTQTFTMTLSDLTVENRVFINSLRRQQIAILIQTRTGNWYAAGLNGQFELDKIEGGTGSKENDMIGYTLTFSGIDRELIPHVDATIVSGLI